MPPKDEMPPISDWGLFTCIGGIPQTCSLGTPTTEVCDSLDNDFDGVVDEGNPGGGAACDGKQTMSDVASEKNSTLILPVPTELLEYLKRAGKK